MLRRKAEQELSFEVGVGEASIHLNKHEFTDQKRGVDSELRERKNSVRETKRPLSLGAKSNVMRASFKCN